MHPHDTPLLATSPRRWTLTRSLLVLLLVGPALVGPAFASGRVLLEGSERIVASDPETLGFGVAVGLLRTDLESPSEIAIGYREVPCDGGECGGAEVRRFDGSDWAPLTPLSFIDVTERVAVGGIDFNDDGDHELLLGSPDLGTGGAGVVCIRDYSPFGGAVGCPISSGDSVAGEGCGWSLAVGDFDGDEMEDFATGCPFATRSGQADAGRVRVGYGQGGFSFDLVTFDQDSSLVANSAEPGDQFGWAVATGDFDGDGFDDLAIGAPGEDVGLVSDGGLVHVLYGSSEGLSGTGSQLFHQGTTGITGTTETGDRFGEALAVGDFDFAVLASNYVDLAIGVPDDDDGPNGSIRVLYGSADGLEAEGSGFLSLASTAKVRFGAALAAGRLAVGFLNFRDDLIVGAPADRIFPSPLPSGRVCAIRGSSSGLGLGTPTTCIVGTDAGATGDGSTFGWAVAIGDLGRGAGGDVVVGAPGPVGDDGSGAAHVFYSSLFSDGFESGDTTWWSATTP